MAITLGSAFQKPAPLPNRRSTVSLSGAVAALALLVFGGLPAASSAQSAAASASSSLPSDAAATLSSIRGRIEVTSERDKSTRTAPADGAKLRMGDRVTVRDGGSAEFTLNATHVRYLLAARTSIRITADGKRIRPVSGPLPRRLLTDGPSGSRLAGDSHGRSGRQPQRIGDVLAPLLDGRIQGSVTRGGGNGGSVYAPVGINPSLGIDAPLGGIVTLKWACQNDPSAGASARFGVRIADPKTGKLIYKTSCPKDARSVTLPPKTLGAGVWYSITVAFLGDDGAAIANRRADGWLRLLTPDEHDWLEKRLQNAARDPHHADLLRARAYETVGEAENAIVAYKSALLERDVSADTVNEVGKRLKILGTLTTPATASN